MIASDPSNSLVCATHRARINQPSAVLLEDIDELMSVNPQGKLTGHSETVIFCRGIIVGIGEWFSLMMNQRSLQDYIVASHMFSLPPLKQYKHKQTNMCNCCCCSCRLFAVDVVAVVVVTITSTTTMSLFCCRCCCCCDDGCLRSMLLTCESYRQVGLLLSFLMRQCSGLDDRGRESRDHIQTCDHVVVLATAKNEEALHPCLRVCNHMCISAKV